MIRVAVTGADGKMGRMILESIFSNDQFELAGALCIPESESIGRDAGEFLGRRTGVLISDDTSCLQEADCLIDFTRVEGTMHYLPACLKHRCNMVVGTTGFTDAQLAQLHEAAADIAIVWSPNMSVGVNALYALLEKAAQLFDEAYDIEIIEAHHRHKVDAPSGTALRLAEVIAEQKGQPLEQIAQWSRHGNTGPRQPGSIGFSVIRGGDIVGDHTVAFCGPGECIEISHRALNRSIFAQGSLKAAAFAAGKHHGFFSMKDVVSSR